MAKQTKPKQKQKVFKGTYDEIAIYKHLKCSNFKLIKGQSLQLPFVSAK